MKKLVLLTAFAALAVVGQNKSNERLVRNVRHELVMLPYYSVYDNLAYRVDGSKVSLFGQVQRPTLKKDAENVVKRIEGVDSVVNEIEVLPNIAPGRSQVEIPFKAIASIPDTDFDQSRAGLSRELEQ